MNNFILLPVFPFVGTLGKDGIFVLVDILDVVDNGQPLGFNDLTVAIRSGSSTPVKVVNDALHPLANTRTPPFFG
jgi:hypothetical protein